MTLGKKSRGLWKRAATGAPLTDVELREFGNALRSTARELSAICRQFLTDEFGDINQVFAMLVHSPASDMESFVKISVRVPAFTVAFAAAILATLPDSRRGRPPKNSTIEALKLLKEVKSSRKVAKLVADATGESSEHIRARLRNFKRSNSRAKKKKKLPKGGGKKSR